MQKKKWILGGLALALVSFAAGAIIRPLTPCQKLDTKIALAEQFCQKVSDDGAQEVCGGQTDDPRLLQLCTGMIQPQIMVACLQKVGLSKMKNDLLNFCGG